MLWLKPARDRINQPLGTLSLEKSEFMVLSIIFQSKLVLLLLNQLIKTPPLFFAERQR